MANVVNEIKNWHLFTDLFGDKYDMHDAVIKRFDLNGDPNQTVDSGGMMWRS